MAFSKEEEAKGEQLPSYEAVPGPSSSQHVGQVEAPIDGPTTDSPFNFPSDGDLPAYSEPSNEPQQQKRPIAIPQITATPTAPFLDAYSQILLRHGVTKETWSGFLRTLSGFLAATVSEKAVSHAAEMAQHVGDVPKRFGKETFAHAKSTGRAISDSAKKGNFIGAATHVVGGMVALPVATAIRAIGATVSLPFVALGAATKDPKTPEERAVAYAAAANIKWLSRRGLHASLLDTAELSKNLGLPAEELLRTAYNAGDVAAEAQLKALGSYIAGLEARIPGPLELGAGTLWLVVTEQGGDDEHNPGWGKGKQGLHK
ncbi:hypothetical protein F5Y04DRAFT_248821 [Hypomontagnella monticulosa]|nr:hypothetical protein F5Y04DRAFT_248821 [Hypomontagnella monticulosa]